MPEPGQEALVVRGAFARFGRDTGAEQRWAPGTASRLQRRDAHWLGSHFPPPSEVGVARGRVWIRWVEGSWFLCHACRPEWSADRSIPAWAVSVISADLMASAPVLAAESAAAVRACASEQSAREWSSNAAQPVAEPWSGEAVSALATLFDVALSGAGPLPGCHAIPRAAMERGGWIALQAMLTAIAQLAGFTPCAVHVQDAAWAPDGKPGSHFPEHAFVIAHAFASPPRSAGTISSRGVELPTFIDSLPKARESVIAGVRAVSGSTRDITSFGEAVEGIVPLELVDPSRIGIDECVRWADRVCAVAPGRDSIPGAVNGLLRRIRAGERGITGPTLALAALWVRDGGHAAPRKQLDEWTTAVLRSR